jgi:peptidoglycan hydrolase-like protein with peptidoglycan-binding domain
MNLRVGRSAGRVGLIAAALALASCAPSDVAPSATSSYQTSVVTLGDLSESVSWSGVLTYANAFGAVYQKTETVTTTSSSGGGGPMGGGARATTTTTATTASTGIVTWVAPASSVLHNGDVLYRVDNVPVILVEGDGVLWRKIAVGDSGDDVLAVETALSALGYDPSATVTVDTSYTSYSRAMSRRFEAAYGLETTTTFPFESVVMRPSDVIVTDIALNVGDAVSTGNTVLTVSDTSRIVTFSLDPADRNKLAEGDAVSVRLSSGDSVAATILSISSGLDTTTSAYDVVASVADPLEGVGDKVEVTVAGSIPLASAALLVPATSLVMRDDGTTTVGVLRDGIVTNVAVTVIATAGSSTAVEASGLAEGDVIVVT